MKHVKAWAAVIVFSILLAAAAVGLVVAYDQPNIGYELTVLAQLSGQVLMLAFGVMTFFTMMKIYTTRDEENANHASLMVFACLAGLLCLGFGGFESWGAQLGLGLVGTALILRPVLRKTP